MASKQTIFIFLFVLAVQAVQGCVSTVANRPVASPDFDHFSQNMARDFNPSAFDATGPYAFDFKKDFKITIDTDTQFLTDLFIPVHSAKAPLVIIQHGNGASKEAHRLQAEHLASWGAYVIVVSQPNRKQWLINGKRLALLVEFLTHWPQLLDQRFDPEKIILVGHSFGGSAVSLAAANGANIRGLILLDPALYRRQLVSSLKQVTVPTVLLGADPKVFTAKRRKDFYTHIPHILEVSLTDTTHDDAQFPSQREINYWMDPATTFSYQQRFAAAIAQSVFLLGFNDSWKAIHHVFAQGIKRGIYKDIRVKRNLLSKKLTPREG